MTWEYFRPGVSREKLTAGDGFFFSVQEKKKIVDPRQQSITFPLGPMKPYMGQWAVNRGGGVRVGSLVWICVEIYWWSTFERRHFSVKTSDFDMQTSRAFFIRWRERRGLSTLAHRRCRYRMMLFLQNYPPRRVCHLSIYLFSSISASVISTYIVDFRCIYKSCKLPNIYPSQVIRVQSYFPVLTRQYVTSKCCVF